MAAPLLLAAVERRAANGSNAAIAVIHPMLANWRYWPNCGRLASPAKYPYNGRPDRPNRSIDPASVRSSVARTIHLPA